MQCAVEKVCAEKEEYRADSDLGLSKHLQESKEAKEHLLLAGLLLNLSSIVSRLIKELKKEWAGGLEEREAQQKVLCSQSKVKNEWLSK